jgi:hypothetical protein
MVFRGYPIFAYKLSEAVALDIGRSVTSPYSIMQ